MPLWIQKSPRRHGLSKNILVEELQGPTPNPELTTFETNVGHQPPLRLTSVLDLTHKALVDEWSQIPTATLPNVVGSISRSVELIFTTKGGLDLELDVQQVHIGVMARHPYVFNHIGHLQVALPPWKKSAINGFQEHHHLPCCGERGNKVTSPVNHVACAPGQVTDLEMVVFKCEKDQPSRSKINHHF